MTLGLARFAYALLLPAMRSDLAWSYGLAGTMTTANALGYVLGAVLAAPLTARLGAKRVFVGGVGLTAGALLASAATLDVEVLLLLRLVAGVGGATAFISGAGLTARLPSTHGRPTLALYYGGAGLGIATSSLAVPPLLSLDTPHAWRLAWLVLGLLGTAALAACILAVRCVPEPAMSPSRAGAHWSPRVLTPTFLGYGFFGAGYIGYMTFIVAALRADGLPDELVALFWAVLGASAVGSAFGWGPVLDRLRGGHGPGLVIAVVLLGAALPLVAAGPRAAFASAVVFGASFMAGPTSVTALVRRAYPPEAWTAAIGALTVAFSVGQSLGPVAIGFLSDGPGGVHAGLAASAVILAVGAAAALFQHEERSLV